MLLGYDYNDVISISGIDLSSAVVIDTETTGIDRENDEVLSLAVVNMNGRELFYSLVRPQRRKRWPNAQKINGITWKDVKDQRTLVDLSEELDKIFLSASAVIGYNVEFDLELLDASGYNVLNRCKRYVDLMEPYSNAHGTRWSEKYDRFMYEKLSSCARHYGYKFKAHNALEDARATAHCFIEFQKECVERLPEAEEMRREKDKQIREIEETVRRANDTSGKSGVGCLLVIAVFVISLFAIAAMTINR